MAENGNGNSLKWITQYPKADVVFKELKDAFEKGEIDYNFITDHFGGNVTEYRDWETDRKSTRLNSSHSGESRMPSSA